MRKYVIDIASTNEELLLQSKQDALDVKRGFLKWLIHLFLLTSVFWFSVVINLILYFFDINVAQYSKIIDENLYFKNHKDNLNFRSITKTCGLSLSTTL